MSAQACDFEIAIIGGGIVGVATAKAELLDHPIFDVLMKLLFFYYQCVFESNNNLFDYHQFLFQLFSY